MTKKKENPVITIVWNCMDHETAVYLDNKKMLESDEYRRYMVFVRECPEELTGILSLFDVEFEEVEADADWCDWLTKEKGYSGEDGGAYYPDRLDRVVKEGTNWVNPNIKKNKRKVAELSKRANELQAEANRILGEIRKLQ